MPRIPSARLLAAVTVTITATLSASLLPNALGSGAAGSTPRSGSTPVAGGAAAHAPARVVVPATAPPVTAAPVTPPSAAPTPAPVRAPVRAPAPARPGVLGHYRVIAYYGAAGTTALGTLGAGTAEHAALRVLARARTFAPYGPTLPAMELIATVARDSPGKDRNYSTPVSHAVIAQYLAAAHRHHMLLVLDLQPGRASFLSQVRALGSLVLDPSVGIGLDPEWKVGSHGRPGDGLIGASSAAGINDVGAYLSAVVAAHHLPTKVLIVHQFTSSMLPDRSRIAARRGVDTIFHADGFGNQTVKRRVYAALHFPARPFGTGFKLFLDQDAGLMTPAQVMSLRPRPDVITYQ